MWVWLKMKELGQTAGFCPCFHLPGQPILELRFFEPRVSSFPFNPLKVKLLSGDLRAAQRMKLKIGMNCRLAWNRTIFLSAHQEGQPLRDGDRRGDSGLRVGLASRVLSWWFNQPSGST